RELFVATPVARRLLLAHHLLTQAVEVPLQLTGAFPAEDRLELSPAAHEIRRGLLGDGALDRERRPPREHGAETGQGAQAELLPALQRVRDPQPLLEVLDDGDQPLRRG